MAQTASQIQNRFLLPLFIISLLLCCLSACSNEMYRALLEALASNKRLRVYVTGRCNIDDYAEISSLGIRS